MPITLDLSSDQLAKLTSLAGPDRTVEQVINELIDNAPQHDQSTILDPASDDEPAEREPWETKFERLKKLIQPFGGNVSADRESFNLAVDRRR